MAFEGQSVHPAYWRRFLRVATVYINPIVERVRL